MLRETRFACSNNRDASRAYAFQDLHDACESVLIEFSYERFAISPISRGEKLTESFRTDSIGRQIISTNSQDR